MFHLFTLQGKRMDVPLEHLHRHLRVHHTGANYSVKKFNEGEPHGENTGGESAGNHSHEAGLYRESTRMEYSGSPLFHASEIMSAPVLTAKQSDPAMDVWVKFRDKKIHHMPVISDEGHLAGIVSDRDLLRNLMDGSGRFRIHDSITVRDVMSTDVIATTPLTDIRRIAKAMFDHNIGAMPVVNDRGSILGILTRSDILYTLISMPELNRWA